MTRTQKAADLSHQEQLDRLQEEVLMLRQQLHHAQRLATVGTMAAMVAHEFNNILTPVVNYAQMAQSNPKLMTKAVAKAADGGKRASEICRAILGVTQESRQVALVNVAELVAQTLAAMARDPAKDGIELSLDVPGELSLCTSRVELQQVVLNLLLNARAAVLAREGASGRRIEVSAKRSGEMVHLIVSDSGVGIPPGNLEKIFQPFFSTKDASEEGGDGHGLGLSICRQIVTELGGTISVQSTPGQGAKFTLRVPDMSQQR